MPNPLSNFLFGSARQELVEVITPRRTFTDVVLPAATRQALRHALVQIEKHDLLFRRWGLGERHTTGLGLAFNFAGPPGTGKTICAEALAHALGKNLMVVRYDEIESMWAGNTGKNVSAVFRFAEDQDAVLFFDEADAIAGRRFTALSQGYQREANAVVNVLLRELETFPGVVIFATNLAANFDPAFERRIRTHILFTMPGAVERAHIWRAQLHATKTPLTADVDFEVLAERFAVSGGDIQNAVLKAAQMAISEPGPDEDKKIDQHHFLEGMQQVLEARQVMGQSLFTPGDGSAAPWQTDELAGLFNQTQQPDALEPMLERLETVEDQQVALDRRLEALQAEMRRRLSESSAALTAIQQGAVEQAGAAEAYRRTLQRRQALVLVLSVALALSALVVALLI